MSGVEQRSADQMCIVLKSHHGAEITVDIDGEGDMCVDDGNSQWIYIAKDELPKLRDWLNKVLS